MNVSQDLLNLQPAKFYSKTHDDFIGECLTQMTSHGISLAGPLNTDGKIHRFQIGQKKNKNGWYIAWDGISCKGNSYVMCIYGSWQTGEKFEYRSWVESSSFDEGERIELQRHLKEKREAAEVAIKAEHDLMAEECEKIWKEVENHQPTEEHLKYLKKKGVKNYHLRFGHNEKGCPSVIIPIRNAAGDIRTLQYISVGQDGTVHKKFHSGGEKKGNYFVIGSIANGKPLYVCEGYATGASPYEATNTPVVVAFDCGNLLPVIENLRKSYPESEITILADDDKETKDQQGKLINPGKETAEKASKKYGCNFLLPKFPNGFRPANGKLPSDFNDLHVYFGIDEIKKQLQQNTFIGWLDPKPIQATLYPVPSFNPEKLLPPILQEWIIDEADRMPCPPDFIAATALVSLGALIGARCAIKPKKFDSWVIIPNLWGGIVGPPSAKKSPAIHEGLKPLNRLIEQAAESSKIALEEYESEKIIFDAEKIAIQDAIKQAAKAKNSDKKKSNNDLGKKAQELKDHQKQAPTLPIPKRYKSNDTTVEKLGELLRDNPAGLLLLRDELVGLISSWDKAGREGDRAFYLEGWNGNVSFDTDRIGRGHIFIPNLCISLFGGIQPDKLIAYLEQSANALGNDGMLQRFQLLVYPDHRAWAWCDRIPNKNARDKVCQLFKALDGFDPVNCGANPADDLIEFPHFCFDEEAQKIFVDWLTQQQTVKLPAEDNPLISQHFAKYDKLFPALALIFHLTNCGVTGIVGPVGVESALLASEWCTYLEAHARRCYGLLADDGLRAAQALASKLSQAKLNDNFTAREVRRNQWRYLTTDSAVQSALDWLEDEGWVKSYEVGGKGPGSGRSTHRYRINPKIKKSNDDEEVVNED